MAKYINKGSAPQFSQDAVWNLTSESCRIQAASTRVSRITRGNHLAARPRSSPCQMRSWCFLYAVSRKFPLRISYCCAESSLIRSISDGIVLARGMAH